MWPTDSLLDAGLFVLSPGKARLDGSVVVQCSWLSPKAPDACPPMGFGGACSPCWTYMSAAGFTGNIREQISGYDAPSGGSSVAVWQTCAYLGGATDVSALGVPVAPCSTGTNAPTAPCPTAQNPGRICARMWPPFTLTASASPPLVGAAKPVGPWSVTVER